MDVGTGSKPPQGKRRAKKPNAAGQLTAAVDSLIGNMPASKAGQVAFLWPRIAIALAQGHKPKAIWSALESAGLKMSLAEFRVYIARAKRRAEKHPQQRQEERGVENSGALGGSPGPGSESSVPASAGGVLDGGAGNDLDENAQDALRLLQKKGPQWPAASKKVKDLF